MIGMKGRERTRKEGKRYIHKRQTYRHRQADRKRETAAVYFSADQCE